MSVYMSVLMAQCNCAVSQSGRRILYPAVAAIDIIYASAAYPRCINKHPATKAFGKLS